MAIPRKRALGRLEELVPCVEKHLAKIAANPTSTAQSHWKHEVRNWLNQMREMLRHVGKKTVREWRGRIEAYEKQLGDRS